MKKTNDMLLDKINELSREAGLLKYNLDKKNTEISILNISKKVYSERLSELTELKEKMEGGVSKKDLGIILSLCDIPRDKFIKLVLQIRASTDMKLSEVRKFLDDLRNQN